MCVGCHLPSSARLSRCSKYIFLLFLKEHERVLKEIAEDRKINKMMRLHGPSASAPSSSTSTTAASQSTAPSQPSSSHHRDGTHCSIQVGLVVICCSFMSQKNDSLQYSGGLKCIAFICCSHVTY